MTTGPVKRPTDPGDAGNPTAPTTHTRSAALGILIAVAGVLVAAWIGFGRFPFGVGGDLTGLYAFIAVIIAAVQVFTGRAAVRTARLGHRTRGWTVAISIVSWASGILCGLTLPDNTAIGLQTIMTGPHEPGLSIAIGVTNPAGIICIGLSITALVLAGTDARGGRPRYDEDAILDAQERAARAE